MELTSSQVAVLKGFKDVGPMEDQVLAALLHHRTSMSSSSVRSRRAELVRKGALNVVSTTKLRSGRAAAVHALTKDGRIALRQITRPTKGKVAA
jgi:hypothetical protein